MFPIDDSYYVQSNQYADSSDLNARIHLHHLYDTNSENLQRWAFDGMLDGAPKQCRLLKLGCGSGELWARSGEQQLAASFGLVTVIPFACNLAVTDTQPLIDYVRSMNMLDALLTEKQAQELESQVQDIIDRKGAFNITKETGLSITQGYAGG